MEKDARGRRLTMSLYGFLMLIVMVSCDADSIKHRRKAYQPPPPPPPPISVCEIASNPDLHPGTIDVEGFVVKSSAYMGRSLIMLRQDTTSNCAVFVLRLGVSPNNGRKIVVTGELHEFFKLGNFRGLVICTAGVDCNNLENEMISAAKKMIFH